MTKATKKELEEVLVEIEERRNYFSDILEEEIEKYDNMPEGLQDTKRGREISDGIDELESIVDNYDEIIYSLNDILLIS